MRDHDPDDRFFRRRGRPPRDLDCGWAEQWAQLFDVYGTDGKPDVARAERMIGLMKAIVSDGVTRALRNDDDIIRLLAQIAVDDHERKLHGRKDFN